MLQRKRTYYTKDVLPARVTRHINNNNIDLKKLVSDQVANLKIAEKRLMLARSELIAQIDQLLDGNCFSELSCVDEQFLDTLLNDVMKEERKFRNDILGQQESIEMIKDAAGGDESLNMHLDVERRKRDELTSALATVVSERETVFSALEIFKRSIDGELCEFNSELQKVKRKYEELQTTVQEEHEKLKKFTLWERNPEAMQKELKDVQKFSGKTDLTKVGLGQ